MFYPRPWATSTPGEPTGREVRAPDFACKVVCSIPGEVVSKFTTHFIDEEDFLISMWLSRRLGGITRSGGGVEG